MRSVNPAGTCILILNHAFISQFVVWPPGAWLLRVGLAACCAVEGLAEGRLPHYQLPCCYARGQLWLWLHELIMYAWRQPLRRLICANRAGFDPGACMFH